MVRNREQAEDREQEVFLRVYKARGDYVAAGKFTTWLFRIGRNLAVNSVRDTRDQRMEISKDAPRTVDGQGGEEKQNYGVYGRPLEGKRTARGGKTPRHLCGVPSARE